jgi:2-dehydro-3-deoxygluconokinase
MMGDEAISISIQPEILSLGEALVEFSVEGEEPLSEARRFVRGFGGDTANFAVAVSRLGGRAGYLTRLGDDEFGASLLALWANEGIDSRFVVRDPEACTGLYFISRAGRQHRFTYYRRKSAASRMRPEGLPAEYIRQARLLHVSGISQCISESACDTVFAAMTIARQAGLTTTYDPNYRAKLCPLDRAQAVIHQAVSMADIVFPSLEDGRALTGLESAEDIARFYLDLGPSTVALKLGGEGALLAVRESRSNGGAIRLRRFEPCPVSPVDMTGAGDTFDGAFAVGYVAGWSLEKCMRFANAAAALTTTGLGAVAPIPRLEAVDMILDRQIEAPVDFYSQGAME